MPGLQRFTDDIFIYAGKCAHYIISMFATRFHPGLLLMLCLLISGLPKADAAAASNNMNVSVLVPARVQLLVGSLNFGASSNPQAVLTAATGIQVHMAAGQPYHLTLDAGLHFSGQRRVNDGAGHFRIYALYQNTGHSLLWGDSGFSSTYAAGASLASAGTGAWQIFTVYGRSPAQTSLLYPPGSYNDTVTVTVHY